MSAALAAAIGIGITFATRTVTVVEFRNEASDRHIVTSRWQAPQTADRNDGHLTPTGGRFSAYRFPWFDRVAVCNGDSERCSPTSRDWIAATLGDGFFLHRSSAQRCAKGMQAVWRSRVVRSEGRADDRFLTDLTAHSRIIARGHVDEPPLCAPLTRDERDADIVRLLEQATLGPTEALVDDVASKGIERWIDEQLALNVTRYTQYPYSERIQDGTFASLCVDDESQPVSPEKFCLTYKIAPTPVGWEFFRQARTAPDQLRMRMAHVWHQIFVTSDGNGTYAYADFHQRLRDNVFGTFENLLLVFALSPQLGEYQNWVRNEPERDGIRPNENFARELMQLFTIGVSQLNDDGSPRLDGEGRPVATYEQDDIEALARILTGFSFPPVPGAAEAWLAPNHYLGDMRPFDEYHDKGAKRLLRGLIDLPPGGSAMTEVRHAIRVLATHPNTAPFISRQLIQKLVTSSPTPGYVARVARVFTDNGHGVHGDLAAVTRAVLLDPEARGARKIDPDYGRLREPVLFWTGMIRALDVITDGVAPYHATAESGQLLFLAPSVFNYFPSDHTLADGATPAPEFALFSSTEFLRRANQVSRLLYNAELPNEQLGPGWRAEPYVRNALGTRAPELSPFVRDAADPDALVDRIDRLFLHGTMRPAMRSSILAAIARVPANHALRRAQLAIELTLASADYHVQR